MKINLKPNVTSSLVSISLTAHSRAFSFDQIFLGADILLYMLKYPDQYFSLSELPYLPAEGALLSGVLLTLKPFNDALEVQRVAALAPHRRAVVTCTHRVNGIAITSALSCCLQEYLSSKWGT